MIKMVDDRPTVSNSQITNGWQISHLEAKFSLSAKYQSKQFLIWGKFCDHQSSLLLSLQLNVFDNKTLFVGCRWNR
jgi:hypothetical protein